MALDQLLIDVLQDPIDHGTLLYVPSRSVLYNPRRRVAYEVRGAIAVLLPDESRGVDDSEHDELVNDPTAVTTGRPS